MIIAQNEAFFIFTVLKQMCLKNIQECNTKIRTNEKLNDLWMNNYNGTKINESFV